MSTGDQGGAGGQPPASLTLDAMFDRALPEPNSGCWLWPTESREGYGHVWCGGRTRRAHIVSYELARGAVPEGLVLDHLCRVRCCINPDHLEPVTQGENIRRSPIMGQYARPTTCPKGHAFDESNTYRAGGQRYCRACRADYARRYRASR